MAGGLGVFSFATVGKLGYIPKGKGCNEQSALRKPTESDEVDYLNPNPRKETLESFAGDIDGEKRLKILGPQRGVLWVRCVRTAMAMVKQKVNIMTA